VDGHRLVEPVSYLYDSALRPFYHGVASGDPLPDRIILWTRVTPPDSVGNRSGGMGNRRDSFFVSLYKTDTTRALASRDYTVKVDVDALQPGHRYFYRFRALEETQ